MPPQTLTITGSELLRIRGQLASEPAATLAKREHAEALHHKSQARAATWTNTIEGKRRMKEKERQERFDREELARQKLDEEEAKVQFDLRRKTIERANRLLKLDGDRMKTFHSKMMFCDVLAEREAQMTLKDELSKLEQLREERYLEMQRQNARKMLERELREKEGQELSSKAAASAQKEQLNAQRDKRLREIEEEMLEGALLRKKAEDDIHIERQAALKRRAQAAQALVETQKANDYLKNIRAEDLARQQREDRKVEEYAARKEHVMQLRKQREKEVFDAKQSIRQRMIDLQAARLAQQQSSEDARIQAQVLEKELKDEKARLEKLERMRKWKEDIDESRRLQMERRQRERERSKVEESQMAEFWGAWCKALDEQEVGEKEERRAISKRLAQEQIRQVELRRRKEEQERKNEVEVVNRAKKALEADNIEFLEYAEKVVRDYAEDEKNVLPLIKDLREFKKGMNN